MLVVCVVLVGSVAIGLPGDVGPDLADAAEVVEDATDFVVAGFGGHEVVEACNLVKRGNRAAVIRRDAGSRVADQEGEVELLEDCGWEHGGVVWLGGRGVGVRRFECCTVRAPVCLDGGGVGGGRCRGCED